jgi:hypothetical protein
MSADRDEITIRKDLLIAQSALYRAQLRYELSSFQDRLSRGAGWVTRGLTIFSVVRSIVAVLSTFRK